MCFYYLLYFSHLRIVDMVKKSIVNATSDWMNERLENLNQAKESDLQITGGSVY